MWSLLLNIRRPYFGVLIVLLAVVGLIGLRGIIGSAGAQNASQPGNVETPKDALLLMQDLNDIYVLRQITPLKLNATQIGELLTTLQMAEANYLKRVNAISVPEFRKNAEAIKEARKQALAGETVKPEFYETMQKMESDFVKKREKLNVENIRTVGAAFKQMLEPKQISTVVRLAKDAAKTAKMSVEGTDEQWINQYVVFMVIGNPRFVPLLKEIQAAQK